MSEFVETWIPHYLAFWQQLGIDARKNCHYNTIIYQILSFYNTNLKKFQPAKKLDIDILKKDFYFDHIGKKTIIRYKKYDNNECDNLDLYDLELIYENKKNVNIIKNLLNCNDHKVNSADLDMTYFIFDYDVLLKLRHNVCPDSLNDYSLYNVRIKFFRCIKNISLSKNHVGINYQYIRIYSLAETIEPKRTEYFMEFPATENFQLFQFNLESLKLQLIMELGKLIYSEKRLDKKAIYLNIQLNLAKNVPELEILNFILMEIINSIEKTKHFRELSFLMISDNFNILDLIDFIKSY